MSQKIRAVLFDLDGTLIDSAPDFIPAVNQLRQEHNLAPLPADRIRATVSNGARALVSLALNTQEGHSTFESNRLRLLDLYRQSIGTQSQAFPGINDLLAQLKARDIHWGIATNKPEEFTTLLLDKLTGLPKADCVICPEHVNERKPHPESLHLAAKLLNCETNEIMYVGDHLRDIECGNSAGSITVAALYGYIEDGDQPENWRAHYSINNVPELWPIIEKHL